MEEQMTKFALPEDLYSYQKEDLNRLLNSDSGYLNLSEMGTGKTPVSIGLAVLGDFKRVLVVCPNSIQLEWARQIKDWTGVDATVSRRGSTRRLEPLFNDFLGKGTPNPWFIVNYETFRVVRHREILNLYPFDLIILDEAHRLRNPKTKQTKGMLDFLSNHPKARLLVLTGSPIVNNPADLHTLLRTVQPGTFTEYGRMDFIREFCLFYKTRYGVKVYGTQNMEELRKMTEPYTIRRTKAEALPFLPDKYYRKVLLEMGDEQRALYDQMEKELFILLEDGEPLWAPSVLALLTRLRQLNLEPKILRIDAPSAKTDFLKEFLESTDEKVVIYSFFEKYIQYLHYTLPQKHIMLTGSVSVPDRMEAVNQFQEDPSVRLALGTIQVMGEGITLTASSNVLMMDRWWTPTAQTQAEDRLHRIGQKNAVQVVIPIMEATIDQSLDKILESKKKVSDEYLGDRDVMREVVDDLRSHRRSAVRA